ncbi:hypothetical protein [Nocardia rhamnosiphila]
MTIGATIRRIRKSSGLTQSELGALIHFEVDCPIMTGGLSEEIPLHVR